MDEPFYLGAYWGPRRESAAARARRLADCFARLGACSELLGSWREKVDRKEQASHTAVSSESEALRELMLAGVNRRDADGSPIDELGFSVGLWNGDREAAIGLSISCGGWASTPGVMNAFVLDLPPRLPGPTAQLYELDTALAIMRAVVEAWEPDWATLTSYELAAALDPAPREPSVGWVTFLSDRRALPGDVPVPFCERLSSKGVLLVAADRVGDVDVSGLREIAATLDEAGTLAPTP